MKNWVTNLKNNLGKTSKVIENNIKTALVGKKVEADILEAIEETLILSDFGVVATNEIIGKLSKKKFTGEVSESTIKQYLKEEIIGILKPVAKSLPLNSGVLTSILFCGINGSGKTTTIGKLASKYSDLGKKVIIAAGDTFRASAVEQLEIWANRSNSYMIKGEMQSDPASIAYKALKEAKDNHYDILLVDTAGRLHNKKNLMEELSKCVKVLKKVDKDAPNQVILVIDGSIGQNSLMQIRTFKEFIDISGIIITKLDGSAKGGVVVAITKEFNLPIFAIGIGESIQDLNDFTPEDFAEALLNIK